MTPVKKENPWDFSKVEDYMFYCCPACDMKCKNSSLFIEHALEIHNVSFDDYFEDSFNDTNEEVLDEKNNVDAKSLKLLPIVQLNRLSIRTKCDECFAYFSTKFEDKSEVFVDSRKRKNEEPLDSQNKKVKEGDFKEEIDNDFKDEIIDSKSDIDFKLSDFNDDIDLPDGESQKNEKQETVFKQNGKEIQGKECHICLKVYHPNSFAAHMRKHGVESIRKKKATKKVKSVQIKEERTRQCQLCDFVAKSETDSKNHYDMHIENFCLDGKYQCPECSFSSDSRTTFVQHGHVLLGEYKCEVCKEIFVTNDKLQIHRLKQHGIEITYPYNCSECDYKTFNKYIFATHMQKRHVGATEVCHICGKDYKELKMHMKFMHGEESKYVICDICGKQLHKSAIKKHRNEHSKSDHICTLCGRFLLNKKKLVEHLGQEHQVSCNESSTFVCHDCKQMYPNGEELQKHLSNEHNLPNDHHCPNCDLAFTIKILLARHLIQQHDFNEFKAAEFLGNTKKVVGNTEDPNRIPCEQCHLTFSSKKTLRDHVKQVHRPHDLKCEDCDFTTFVNYKLKKHRIRVHDPQIKFSCDQCSFKCNIKCDMERHIAGKHKGTALHSCSECGRQLSLGLLIKHMLYEHNIVYKHFSPYSKAKV